MTMQSEAPASEAAAGPSSVSGVQLQLPRDLGWPQQTVTDAQGNQSGLQLSTSSGGQAGGPTFITSSLTVRGPLNPAGGIKMAASSSAPKGANLQNVQVDINTGILYSD